ncbi:MAG: hypothetical protein RL023_268 [Candidatus Parcubacteria bacterium]|jgi:hypothetical protein
MGPDGGLTTDYGGSAAALGGSSPYDKVNFRAENNKNTGLLEMRKTIDLKKENIFTLINKSLQYPDSDQSPERDRDEYAVVAAVFMHAGAPGTELNTPNDYTYGGTMPHLQYIKYLGKSNDISVGRDKFENMLMRTMLHAEQRATINARVKDRLHLETSKNPGLSSAAGFEAKLIFEETCKMLSEQFGLYNMKLTPKEVEYTLHAPQNEEGSKYPRVESLYEDTQEFADRMNQLCVVEAPDGLGKSGEWYQDLQYTGV